mmetsp:Transcript_63142/g.112225  ORF Transcript_63142/g.112225 Transcript_63142/m.112225 type:complete len:97 (-) Transcript_63142:1789-2079(-)
MNTFAALVLKYKVPFERGGPWHGKGPKEHSVTGAAIVVQQSYAVAWACIPTLRVNASVHNVLEGKVLHLGLHPRVVILAFPTLAQLDVFSQPAVPT